MPSKSVLERRQRLPERVAVAVVFVVMSVSGGLKVLYPERMFGLGHLWAVAVGACEVIAAVALLTRVVLIGLMFGVLIAVLGAVASVLFPDRACGCLGKAISLTSNQHLMFAGLLGFWSCVGIWLQGKD